MSCSMRWRGKNCSKMGHERLRQSLSSLGSCVILKGMRSLLSTYQMMLFFLVCQIRSSSSTYLSGIGHKGPHSTQLRPRPYANHDGVEKSLPVRTLVVTLSGG